MAVPCFGAGRYISRFSLFPAAASSSSMLQAGKLEDQLRNQFSTRELQSSERKDGGVLFWMTRRIASYLGTKLQSNMGSSGQDGHAETTLIAAFTKNLGNGGDYQRFLPISSVWGQNPFPFAASGTLNTAGNRGAGTQQIRTIMVEVKKNDLERAIRQWKRKCKEENLRALKLREYYIKPSQMRVLARKERDLRISKRAFKQKLNWIMGRRQRGF